MERLKVGLILACQEKRRNCGDFHCFLSTSALTILPLEEYFQVFSFFLCHHFKLPPTFFSIWEMLIMFVFHITDTISLLNIIFPVALVILCGHCIWKMSWFPPLAAATWQDAGWWCFLIEPGFWFRYPRSPYWESGLLFFPTGASLLPWDFISPSLPFLYKTLLTP